LRAAFCYFSLLTQENAIKRDKAELAQSLASVSILSKKIWRKPAF
jgi:hypothetical protein